MIEQQRSQARGARLMEESQWRHHVNANRLRAFGADTERTIVFLCECERLGCLETVRLTAGEYEDCSARDELVLHPHHAPATVTVPGTFRVYR
jgi:hypothetical protein